MLSCNISIIAGVISTIGCLFAAGTSWYMIKRSDKLYNLMERAIHIVKVSKSPKTKQTQANMVTYRKVSDTRFITATEGIVEQVAEEIEQVNMNVENISDNSEPSENIAENIAENISEPVEVEYAPVVAPNNSENDDTSYEDDDHCSIQLQAIESDEHLYETIDGAAGGIYVRFAKSDNVAARHEKCKK